ncbi:MAG: TetR/AcrR family transcriptional regulator [Burkholderiales bacterium]|jgi:AcrR family transcriptional regulator|nr:TetR/AcrR family transcriptional regulator [Burkholderiales bacterium]
MLQPVVPKARAPRADNRLQRILDEAARLFREKGYQGASVRDISRSVDMLPGSLYYHFANKDDLLVAVYAEGVRRVTEAVREAVAAKTEPWERLEAACVAHLEALLDPGDYGQVVIRVHPADAPGAADRLVALRGGYEKTFRDLLAALPLPAGADRKTLRLMLLGALNWTQTWYRPGKLNPRRIARQYVALLREQLGGA